MNEQEYKHYAIHPEIPAQKDSLVEFSKSVGVLNSNFQATVQLLLVLTHWLQKLPKNNDVLSIVRLKGDQ